MEYCFFDLLILKRLRKLTKKMKNAQKYHLNPIEKFLIRIWRYFLSVQHDAVLMW